MSAARLQCVRATANREGGPALKETDESRTMVSKPETLRQDPHTGMQTDSQTHRQKDDRQTDGQRDRQEDINQILFIRCQPGCEKPYI